MKYKLDIVIDGTYFRNEIEIFGDKIKTIILIKDPKLKLDNQIRYFWTNQELHRNIDALKLSEIEIDAALKIAIISLLKFIKA